MRRQVTWSDEALEGVRRHVDPLPGKHIPPMLGDVNGDLIFIVEMLAERFDQLEDHSHGVKRFQLQEPLSAQLMTVLARLVDDKTVEVTSFAADTEEPPVERTDWPDDPSGI